MELVKSMGALEEGGAISMQRPPSASVSKIMKPIGCIGMDFEDLARDPSQFGVPEGTDSFYDRMIDASDHESIKINKDGAMEFSNEEYRYCDVVFQDLNS